MRKYKLLPCPRCSADSTVIYARGTPAGTFRRRVCSVCGFRFATEERILGAQERPFPARIFLEALAAAGIDIDLSGLAGEDANGGKHAV